VGRDEELAELREFWRQSRGGVLALVGLGGAGKTAVASRFLQEILSGHMEPRPRGLFVWSFYQEPDAGLFLDSVCCTW
jgi:ATP-dependent Clp protease ATP-binding subunit ClpA